MSWSGSPSESATNASMRASSASSGRTARTMAAISSRSRRRSEMLVGIRQADEAIRRRPAVRGQILPPEREQKEDSAGRSGGGPGRRAPRASGRRRGARHRSRSGRAAGRLAKADTAPAIASRSRTRALGLSEAATPLDPQWRGQVDEPADLEPGRLVEDGEPGRAAGRREPGAEELGDRGRTRSRLLRDTRGPRGRSRHRADGGGDRLGQAGLADPGLAFEDHDPAVVRGRPPCCFDAGQLAVAPDERRRVGEAAPSPWAIRSRLRARDQRGVGPSRLSSRMAS